MFKKLRIPDTHLIRSFQGKRFFSNKFIVKSRFECPELNSDLVKLPLPLFVMKDFLKPDRINLSASVCGKSEKELTFGDSHYASYSLADSLKDMGIAKGDCVGIMSPNDLYYFPTFMGIGLTGAVSSCINPLYSETEISHQLETTNSKAIFVHPMCLEKVIRATEGKNIKIIVMDGIVPIDHHVVENHKLLQLTKMCSTQAKKAKYDHAASLLKDFDPEALATLPFSSGTTGKSKGVMLTHRNLVANVLQYKPLEGKFFLPTGNKPRGTALVPLPFFHIYGLTVGLLCTHYLGARLVFMPAFDLQRFLELAQQYKITRTYLVPPIILALSKHPMVSNYDLSSLECIISGAAPLGQDIQVACAERLKCYVKQAWGMTELSPMGTMSVEEMAPNVKDLKGTSGLLVAATEGKIIHSETGADMNPLEEGELLIRGPQVMKGYLNNPEATAQTITSDGWLRTGDIARFDEQGWLYITDRMKELIKYKGFQVPPAELEAIIASMPEVKDVIVIPVPDEEAGEIPRAYVVKQDHCPADFTEQDVLEYVHERVAPSKKIRGGVIFTNQIPKSPSGKLLRRVQIQIDREMHPHDLAAGKKK